MDMMETYRAVSAVLLGIFISIRIFAKPGIRQDILFAVFSLVPCCFLFPDSVQAPLIFLAACTIGTHICSALREKATTKWANRAKAAKPTPPPEPAPVVSSRLKPAGEIKPTPPPEPKEKAKTLSHLKPVEPSMPQTLNTCLRCGAALRGPVCRSCGYDHRSEPICLLSFVHARDLQIVVE
jgi:hypothetical protein